MFECNQDQVMGFERYLFDVIFCFVFQIKVQIKNEAYLLDKNKFIVKNKKENIYLIMLLEIFTRYNLCV